MARASIAWASCGLVANSISSGMPAARHRSRSPVQDRGRYSSRCQVSRWSCGHVPAAQHADRRVLNDLNNQARVQSTLTAEVAAGTRQASGRQEDHDREQRHEHEHNRGSQRVGPRWRSMLPAHPSRLVLPLRSRKACIRAPTGRPARLELRRPSSQLSPLSGGDAGGGPSQRAPGEGNACEQAATKIREMTKLRSPFTESDCRPPPYHLEARGSMQVVDAGRWLVPAGPSQCRAMRLLHFGAARALIGV